MRSHPARHTVSLLLAGALTLTSLASAHAALPAPLSPEEIADIGTRALHEIEHLQDEIYGTAPPPAPANARMTAPRLPMERIRDLFTITRDSAAGRGGITDWSVEPWAEPEVLTAQTSFPREVVYTFLISTETEWRTLSTGAAPPAGRAPVSRTGEVRRVIAIIDANGELRDLELECGVLGICSALPGHASQGLDADERLRGTSPLFLLPPAFVPTPPITPTRTWAERRTTS